MINKNIVNTYKDILDSSKSALTYMVVFSAFTMIFGYISLYTFLWERNYLWIINNVEYKTIAVWGLPISFIFFGGSSLGLMLYKKRSADDWRILFAVFIVFFSFSLLLLIKFFLPHLFYSMFTAVIGLSGLISAITLNDFAVKAIERKNIILEHKKLVTKYKELREGFQEKNEELQGKNEELLEKYELEINIAYLKKVGALEVKANADLEAVLGKGEVEEGEEENIALNKGLLFFIAIVLLSSLVWAGLSGKWQAEAIKDDNYLMIAEVDNNQFGVLVNNGSTFILVDLNNTDRLKIVSSTKIGYLTKNKKK